MNPLRPFISHDAALWILSGWLVLPVKCGLFAWVGFSKFGLANKLSPFQWVGRFIMLPMQVKTCIKALLCHPLYLKQINIVVPLFSLDHML